MKRETVKLFTQRFSRKVAHAQIKLFSTNMKLIIQQGQFSSHSLFYLKLKKNVSAHAINVKHVLIIKHSH